MHALKMDFFPTSLEEAKVVPVFKFDDRRKLTNYRPLSMLSCFSKILEKNCALSNDRFFKIPTQCCARLTADLDQNYPPFILFWI